jgi:hypothetical protein
MTDYAGTFAMTARCDAGVAGKATLPVPRLRVGRRDVWIVAGTAPHSGLAGLRTAARSDFFGMACDACPTSGMVRVHVRSEDRLQYLARPELLKLAARIQDTRLAAKVALFADTVALSAAQSCGVNHVFRGRTRDVCFDVSVTTPTVNGDEVIQWAALPGVTEQAVISDDAFEVRDAALFITRRHAIVAARRVERNR